MSIDTTKPIASVTYNGTEVPMQSDRFRQWTYVSDGTCPGIDGRSPSVLIENDPWIKQHYADENLNIDLSPKFTSVLDTSLESVLHSHVSNRARIQMPTYADFGAYQRYIVPSSGNPYINTYTVTAPLYDPEGKYADAVGRITVDANGNIWASLGGGGSTLYAPQAGEWTITAFLV